MWENRARAKAVEHALVTRAVCEVIVQLPGKLLRPGTPPGLSFDGASLVQLLPGLVF